ncbi:MAG: S1 RNA-binding domain-containing protein [Erysipelotrichaceae bacterium]|nr:S1 RNA-binding domain-containing protein [Erysipelotrichaceae bacterium]MBQ1482470.1 S1 RNA-binding domain-containing protein [Erysipelotrichaceae bacterium]
MTVYGKITGIKPYGAFVKFDDGVTGLIHISEISNGFVRNIDNFVQVDEYVMVKVIDIDYEHKQLRLSFKALSQNTRRYTKRVRFQGMPESIRGFGTIRDHMNEWIENEKKRS